MSELLARVKKHIEECGDCWLWRGAVSGRQRELPQITLHVDGKKTNVSVRRALRESLTGRKVRSDHIVSTTCRTFGCVNPAHLVEITISERNRRMARDGVYADPVRRSRIAEKLRASRSTLTPDAVADIRQAESASVAAERHGISKSSALRIRAWECWKEYGKNPFSGLMG
jgi:hypothetical protein